MTSAAYVRFADASAIPQSEPLPGQQQNNAGGFSFAVDDWTRLDRFLVLGSENSAYYVSSRTLTRDNAAAILRLLDTDPLRVVDRVVAISEAGRAPKNDPALFVLALALASKEARARQAAREALPRVARIGTHLLNLAAYVDGLRGWGRGLRTAFADWYLLQPVERLVYQAIKYQARDGWAQRDLLRLTHPKTADPMRNAIFYWIVKGWESVGDAPHPDRVLARIWAVERAKRLENTAAGRRELIRLIDTYDLPREAIPTELLNHADVYEALLQRMPMTAMLRNIATMTRIGLIAPNSMAAATVAKRLRDGERLRRARIHPLQVLVALTTYSTGTTRREQGYTPVQTICDALDAAFGLAFEAVEPANVPLVLALDVSGSMGSGTIAGCPGITPAVGSAAMAMVTARTEPRYALTAFSHEMVPVTINGTDSLKTVTRRLAAIPMGGTDCSLPMLWALENKIEADAFVVYTDNETWAGKVHPVKALAQYRARMGRPARLVVVGMTATEFSIADPDDAGMLDVVGFDTAAPSLISRFCAGRDVVELAPLTEADVDAA